MTADLVSQGAFTFFGGGALGFVIGYAMKKVLKFVLVGLGLIFALLMYLNYKGYINVNWSKVSNDVSNSSQQIANQTLLAVNSTAHQIAHSNLNNTDILYPVLGTVGFIPGAILGIMKG